MLVPTKPWYKSKLFWFGVLQFVGGAIELLLDALDNPELGVAGILSGLLTIIGRKVTVRPMTFTGKAVKNVTEES